MLRFMWSKYRGICILFLIIWFCMLISMWREKVQKARDRELIRQVVEEMIYAENGR